MINSANSADCCSGRVTKIFWPCNGKLVTIDVS
ncbi:MAG TPA: hypothetical protein ENI26_03510 [Methylophaga aminisulfidivorans]|uniref:Uncharacterized protein n=1 Tax=Methylophaga aminisulfidivorans TaxID=230105 RepID=A0A7C1VYX5_9GAMM|nr:hypothetical protein [Methylophaga aminisulfidivorans]